MAQHLEEALTRRFGVEWVARNDWQGFEIKGISGGDDAPVLPRAGSHRRARLPHLAAIAPWEGFIDHCRDVALRGGILNLFVSDVIVLMNAGRNRAEDLAAMAGLYPFIDEYWAGKRIDLSKIDVPAYVVASLTNDVHTRGTLEAFRHLDPAKTRLRVHNTQEWPDQYANEEDRIKFFDHMVLKKDKAGRARRECGCRCLTRAGRTSTGPSRSIPLLAPRKLPCTEQNER